MAQRKPVGYLESADPLLLQPSYPLFEEGAQLGRDSERCAIILSREFVSRQHCALVPEGDGVSIVDLGTTNGTFVNGTRVQRQRLNEGDRIGLGKAEPHHFIFTHSLPSSTRKYMLPSQNVYRIGRTLDSDLPLMQDPTVSERHARIRVQAGKLTLEDLGSASGTFVHGEPVRIAALDAADVVRIGTTEFTFQLTPLGLRVQAQERRNQVRLEARNLVRTHKSQQLLRNINLVIQPGEYVGVLGPSGAGKSTLLNALCGFQPANGGQVLLNGTSLYESYDMYRNAIGYVPQDDIIHRELTVERSLTYTAQLRLFRSGGQRKRVSIGCELLTRPSLIFLDEPTSGLDPSTEEKLMRYFRRMSEQGQSVVITTHILYNLDLLDMVVLLARGRLVYFGPTATVCQYFSTPETPILRPIEIFDLLEPDSPDPTLREQRAEFYEKKYQHSPEFKEYVVQRSAHPSHFERPASSGTATVPAIAPPARKTRRNPLRGLFSSITNVRQMLVLARRNLDQKISIPARLAVPLLTPIILALLTATMSIGDQSEKNQARLDFERDNPAFLTMLDQPGMPMNRQQFIEMRYEGFGGLGIPLNLPLTMVMTVVFLGTLSAALEISGERPIYLRERAVKLGIPAYVASKLPALFVLSAVQAFLYVAVTMVLLRPPDVDIFSLALVSIAVAWVSCIIGLFISSLDPTPGQNSVILAVIAMLPQMIFSGAMAPAFYGGMSTFAQGVAAILPARWGFELMLTAMYQEPEWARRIITGESPAGMGFQFGGEVYTRNAAALGVMALVYFIATCVNLRRYDKL
jgi:ABC-type multidrug transport system ATPase subunit